MLRNCEVTIVHCDQGHSFAHLPQYPMKDGHARCPHCMARELDTLLAQKEPETRDELLAAINRYQQRVTLLVCGDPVGGIGLTVGGTYGTNKEG